MSRGGGDRGRRQDVEWEGTGREKLLKERVRDREGQDVEGGEKWEARRGWWGESVLYTVVGM